MIKVKFGAPDVGAAGEATFSTPHALETFLRRLSQDNGYAYATVRGKVVSEARNGYLTVAVQRAGRE